MLTRQAREKFRDRSSKETVSQSDEIHEESQRRIIFELGRNCNTHASEKKREIIIERMEIERPVKRRPGDGLNNFSMVILI